MNCLFFVPFTCTYTITLPTFSILENAEEFFKQGNVVKLFYCDGKRVSTCLANMSGNRMACRCCNLYQQNLFAMLSDGIEIIPLSKMLEEKTHEDHAFKFEYNSVKDIQNIIYKGARIGYAALSIYLTISRNMNPLIDEAFKAYFDKLLEQGARYTDLALAALDKYSPDTVAVFNTRMLYARPMVDLCEKQGIDYIAFETVCNTQNEGAWTFFKNDRVHSVEYNTERINRYWASSLFSEEEKIRIAEQFFYKRRNAVPAADKVYIEAQQAGKLPDNWDSTKHNIVIFNSSEDELASCYEGLEDLFPSQFEGIKYMFNQLKEEKDIHIYLRIHPNLTHINYLYHTKLYEFREWFNNITIIPPSSDISTYALIDAADKVVVFGSTTGVESVYWGKPVILLSNFAMYLLLDICYMPKNKEEIVPLLQDRKLQPKDKLGALKFAYYYMNDEYPAYQFFKNNKKTYKFFSQSVIVYKLMLKKKKWRSYYAILIQIIGKYFCFSNLNYPEEEDITSYMT